MNRYFVLSIFFGVLSFLATLTGCSTPADYYENVQVIVNKATPAMKEVDMMMKDGKIVSSSAKEDLSRALNKLNELGPYKEDSMLMIPALRLVSLYNDVASADIQNNGQNLTEEEFKVVKFKAFQVITQSYRIDLIKAHDEFAKKYELMRGMMAIE